MAASTPPNRFTAYFKEFFREFPDFSIQLTQHARERMRERGINLPQIQSVLRSGKVVQVEQDIRTGEDKYTVAGRDADERNLEIVAVLQETETGRVVIVTVIDATASGSGARRRRRGNGGRRLPRKRNGG
ncbi:MAG: DUF4258 domain-containing protein [Rhodospirillaceae bacterium]|nr:DUF4258 domain-containing protein [Rhodospirillaceae bacterium]